MKKDTDGHQYEYDCAQMLKQHGFSKIEVTKGSGDQGIDIIAYKNGKKYGIQCKYYSSPVGNHAVQEAYAGSKYYSCDVAVVLTNTVFTKSAQELAQKTGVILWENNHVPFSSSRSKSTKPLKFRITKWIGIFYVTIGGLGLWATNSIISLKYPILQEIYAALFILGGLFNIFEFGKFQIEILAALFYILASICSIIVGFVTSGKLDNNCFTFLIAAIASILRANKLRSVKPNCSLQNDIKDAALTNLSENESKQYSNSQKEDQQL